MIEFRIVVTNAGSVPATGVQVVDTLPAFLDLISVQTTKGVTVIEGRTVRVLIDTLAPGEVVTIIIRAKPNGQPQPPGARNEVQVTLPTPDADPGDNSATTPIPPPGPPPGVLPVTGADLSGGASHRSQGTGHPKGGGQEAAPIVSGPLGPVSVVTDGAGVRIGWRAAAPESLAATDDQGGYGELDAWPLVEIGGLRLPARLLALRLDGDAAVRPLIESVSSVAWRGQLLPVAALTPKLNEGRLQLATNSVQSLALPSAPVFIFREGRLRDTRIIVIAVSPIYAEGGQPRLATALQAVIPGAEPLTASTAELLERDVPFLTAASPPVNALAFVDCLKINVTNAGIQRVTGAALAAAGLDLATADPKRLHLWHSGGEVALQVIGAAGGRLAPTDELRFYAAAVGDRWNRGETYWLTTELLPGLRMELRYAVPGNPPVSTTASGRGVWRNNSLYDSVQPGPDGDHWYAAELNVVGGGDAVHHHGAADALPAAPSPRKRS